MTYTEFLECRCELYKLIKEYEISWKNGASKAKLARLANQINKLDEAIMIAQGRIYY